ncbi:Vi polysaccharide biosynthesis UDP-N-acetylglucosamine C-6 dehydrogenase TviB [Gammaproteobacteria bacterium]|nr:Vi polysaccharide biosynthesis UDP-N-acetylglucosamine C-6 dehydrogenase TviB [Gammaproteobacteria bacterium]
MSHLELKIAIIGLGYVGLPLAAEFAKSRTVIGFDINDHRISDLNSGFDSTLELSKKELSLATGLSFTSEIKDLEECTCFIVTVPTPIDEYKQPNLEPLKSASKNIGQILKKDDVVIFESTVYPGASEEVCTPVLESASGLKLNKDFTIGYSPERINPGDKEHRLPNIKKITSGSTKESANIINDLYSSIITAGTFLASSIKVAEAAKVIENTQRDVNIALINELALIFEKLDIDTEEVLNAAGTKWNFLPFKPGLVGGHCIGVDPYYLTFKAQSVGYQPEIILAGRRLNDSMGQQAAVKLVKQLVKARVHVSGSNILVMGLTFKENCPDTRNTKVYDLIDELNDLGASIDAYDPWVEGEIEQSNFTLINSLEKNTYDAIVIAVAHREFIDMGIQEIRSFGKSQHIIFDLKYSFPSNETDLRL